MKFKRIVSGSYGNCGSRDAVENFWKTLSEPKVKTPIISEWDAPPGQDWCTDFFKSYHYM